MVESEIKMALPDPFVWYESYRYRGMDRDVFHCHPVWQMTVVTEGGMRFNFGAGEVLFLNAGDVMLVAPETVHEGHSIAGATHSMQLFCRYFDRQIMPDAAQSFSPFQVDAVWRGHGEAEVFRNLSGEILTRCANDVPFGCSWRFPLLSAFLVTGLECLEDLKKEDAKRFSPELFRIFQYMLTHYRDMIGVNDLAAMAHLSPSRFSAVFREQVGQSPLHYLNMLRLGMAQKMLLQGASLAEAAAASGFHSSQYFCRYFRRRTGQSPGEFRENPFSRHVLLH